MSENTANNQLPPGDIIKASVTTPSLGELNLNTFYKPGTTLAEIVPMQPLVSATLIEATTLNKSRIQVKTVIFINTKNQQGRFEVRQNIIVNSLGEPQFQFFISNTDQNEDMSDITEFKYKAHEIMFNAEIPENDSDSSTFPNYYSINDIKCVQVYLWNIDPKTSRGTETVVQST